MPFFDILNENVTIGILISTSIVVAAATHFVTRALIGASADRPKTEPNLIPAVNERGSLPATNAGAEATKKEHTLEEESVDNNSAAVDHIGFEPYKMVLCVNTALQMGKGKIGAQCGHAAVGAYSSAVKYSPKALKVWETTGCAKITLKAEDDTVLFQLQKTAKQLGMITYLVADAGRTQIPAGSITVLAIGPAPNSMFEGLTGHLKLLN
jgi:peptidyl-tRNA hydrolase, PTH2 family